MEGNWFVEPREKAAQGRESYGSVAILEGVYRHDGDSFVTLLHENN